MDGARPRTEFGAFLREVGDGLVGDRIGRVPSGPAPTVPSRRLSTPTMPIEGESLRGLVARACAGNDLPNSWGLLRHLGQRHRNRVLVSEDPDIDAAELAYAIGTDEREVRSRRYEPIAPGRTDFFGMEINERRIETRVRRFSPIALRRLGGGFHRAAWELRDLPFCLEGWNMLQDRCGCERTGLVQGWTRTLTRIDECDRCGDPLAWLEPFEVPIDMRPALEALKAIVDPLPVHRQEASGILPEGLRRADRGVMFRLVVRIADAIDPRAVDRPIEDVRARLDGLHRACLTLLEWPRGLDRIPVHSGTKPAALVAIRTAWRSLAPTTAPCLPRPAASASGCAINVPACVGIRRATEIAALSSEVLTAAWRHGLVSRRRRIHGDRTLPAFDPDELPDFGRRWRERVGPQSFAHRLGISYHGVEQMVAMGVIEADAARLPGTGPHFTAENVRGFLSQLAEPTLDQLQDAVPLIDAIRLIGGRPKPWGPILDALSRGGLPFSLREGERPIDRIMIAGASASTICGMSFDPRDHAEFPFSDRMIRRDALETLNFSSAGTEVIDALPSTGSNPKTYAVDDVERLAAAIVSLPELAARWDTDPVSAQHDLKRRGMAPIMPGGWDRSLLTSPDFVGHRSGLRPSGLLGERRDGARRGTGERIRERRRLRVGAGHDKGTAL